MKSTDGVRGLLYLLLRNEPDILHEDEGPCSDLGVGVKDNTVINA
jgi:hypothetical protein